MESIQQFELILLSKMESSPLKCSNTDDLTFGDNFANGETGVDWILLESCIYTLHPRSLLEIRGWIHRRNWLPCRTWQRRENVHRRWVSHAPSAFKKCMCAFDFMRSQLINYRDSTSGHKIMFCVIHGAAVASNLKISFVFKIQSKKTNLSMTFARVQVFPETFRIAVKRNFRRKQNNSELGWLPPPDKSDKQSAVYLDFASLKRNFQRWTEVHLTL